MVRPERETNARLTMLAAIRARLLGNSAHELLPATAQVPVRSRSAAPVSPVPPTELLNQFKERLAAVGGKCCVVANEQEAGKVLAAIVTEKKPRRVARSDSPRVERLTTALAAEVEVLATREKQELFKCEIGITEAQWAIAESGTLVLESDRERNRLVSLVPPVHVAILDAHRICRTMAEVLHLVQRSDTGLSRAVTFITGTSRTSDIELTLAIGVHGPAELHLIVLAGGAE